MNGWLPLATLTQYTTTLYTGNGCGLVGGALVNLLILTLYFLTYLHLACITFTLHFRVLGEGKGRVGRGGREGKGGKGERGRGEGGGKKGRELTNMLIN